MGSTGLEDSMWMGWQLPTSGEVVWLARSAG